MFFRTNFHFFAFLALGHLTEPIITINKPKVKGLFTKHPIFTKKITPSFLGVIFQSKQIKNQIIRTI